MKGHKESVKKSRTLKEQPQKGKHTDPDQNDKRSLRFAAGLFGIAAGQTAAAVFEQYIGK